MPAATSVSRLRALALAPEIPLTELARHFGISRRLVWEEPLGLAGSHLQAILPHAGNEQVFLFAFGAVVFVDCDDNAVRRVLDRLGQHHASLHKPNPFQWSDDYTLTIDRNAPFCCDNDGVTIAHVSPALLRVLATVLALSVALERVEASLETVLDQSEKRIEALERGELRGADAGLARDAGAVLRLEHESIHYLGLPDKPECTWTDPAADALYNQLARQFELRERFAAVRHRVDVLKELNSTFANLAHAKRSARLEWIIILLIAFEIVLPAARWLLAAGCWLLAAGIHTAMKMHRSGKLQAIGSELTGTKNAANAASLLDFRLVPDGFGGRNGSKARNRTGDPNIMSVVL